MLGLLANKVAKVKNWTQLQLHTD